MIAAVGIVAKRGLTAAAPHLLRLVEWLNARRLPAVVDPDTAALIGSDEWRFGTLAVLAGVVLLGTGAWLNRDYLRELFLFRGASRRGEKRSEPRGAVATSQPRTDSSVMRPPVVPGLADSPGVRSGVVRGDRETPIMTAREPVSSEDDSAGGDTPQNGQPRLRIR